MIRKRKKFSWPKKLYDGPRIADENKTVSQYGLKNKREIWKTESKVKYFRNRAKELITADGEEQKVFFNKLNEIGLNVNSIADVLALSISDLLNRRLSTIVVKRGLATTPKQARQMIVHKKIMVGDKMVNSPSYFVKVNEETLIAVKKKATKAVVKQEEPAVAEEVVEVQNE